MTEKRDAGLAKFERLHARLKKAIAVHDPLAKTRIMDELKETEDTYWKQPPGTSPFVDQDLESFRSSYARGNKIALFHAIRYCANGPSLLPPWIRKALNEGMTRYDYYYEKTLDDSFDVARPKDAKLAQRKDFERFGTDVYIYVITEKQKGVPLTDKEGGVYYEAGRLFNKSPSTIRKWVKKTKSTLEGEH